MLQQGMNHLKSMKEEVTSIPETGKWCVLYSLFLKSLDARCRPFNGFSVGAAIEWWLGAQGGSNKSPPHGVEDAEPVVQIPVGLPSLERGRRLKKKMLVA